MNPDDIENLIFDENLMKTLINSVNIIYENSEEKQS